MDKSHIWRTALGAAWLLCLAAFAGPACAQGASVLAPPAALVAGAGPARSCASLQTLNLAHTTIDAAAQVPGVAGAADWCRVTATVSYPATGERFTVWIGLPLQQWNGRFEGIGGGGFQVGSADPLAGNVAMGFAAASTDGGIQRPADSRKPAALDGSFALDGAGRLNWNLVRDFAYRGIHEMTVTGKAVTAAFYGQAAPRSYFYGCSTGGRQGQMEAQRFPEDYDGIVSGAPVVNWPKVHVAQMWGPEVMLEAHHVVAPCKLAAATAAAIAACDALDGVRDGVIGLPRQCHFDPKALIGTTAGECGAFTAADADVIRRIWQGPRRSDGSFLWYGLEPGAPLAALNGGTDPSGQPGAPFPITTDWFRYFLTQNPGWDWKGLTPESYEAFWDQSVQEYGAVIGTDDPDLSAFRRHGGKALLWHGEADQLVFPEGTIDYFQRVQQHAGGAAAAAQFIRLFMAPGVGHCGGGDGPQPEGQLDSLIRWVETGTPPEQLRAVSRNKAGESTRSRPLCPFPAVARYGGHGSTDDAASFTCGEAPTPAAKAP
jgi:feruloyl esterase